MILESFSSSEPTDAAEEGVKQSKALLLVVSAKTQKALSYREQSLLKYMSLHADRLGDLAYTLGDRREHLSHRGFFLSKNGKAPDTKAINHSIAANSMDLCYVFTGQGAQWAGMGKGLMDTFKSFRDDIQSLDAVLQNLKRAPSWTIEGKHIVMHHFVGSVNDSPELIRRTCKCRY